MVRFPFPRAAIVFSSLLLILSLACGALAGAPTATPFPTSTPLLPPLATAVTEALPTQPAHESVPDVTNGRQATNSAVSQALNRATTMMTQNAKPTPPPNEGIGGKEGDGAAATATPLPTPVPQRGNVGLQLHNRSSTAGCFVYISLPTDSSWGADRLDASEVISVGADRLFELAAGVYDLRIDDCNGKILYAEFEINVADMVSIQLLDRALPQAGNAAVTTINDLTDETVCYLYISPATSTTWGGDWLGTGKTLASGNSNVFYVPEDEYDLQAIDCSMGTIAELFGVTVDRTGYVWALSGATGLATLELVNNGRTSVCYVQISLATAETWGPDWLGAEELVRAGVSRLFELTPDIYDLRAMDCDQNVLSEEYGIAVQGSTRWTIP
jgi:hypothetical protein